MARLQFWIEYGSTYTYLSVARIAAMAERAGVQVDWRPFHLQPILNEQGRPEGPFVEVPAKLQHMWADLERRAKRHAIAYCRPRRYPINSMLAARIATVAAQQGWCRQFTERAFRLHWEEGVLMDTRENVWRVLQELGRDGAAVFRQAEAAHTAEALRTQTQIAKSHGIFGAPSFIAGDQLFWGDDRLEEALDWARSH